MNVPCDVISLDVQDDLGNHYKDIKGNLQKVRINKNGIIIETLGDALIVIRSI
jgi:predicted RNA-binding protein